MVDPFLFSTFLTHLLRKFSHTSHAKIAEYLTCIKPKGISPILARCEVWLKTDKKLMTHISSLIDMILIS